MDVLKLYRGKDVVRKEPEDIDPDRWLDEGELTKLPSADQRNPEIPSQPALEIQIILEDTEETGVREGIHERI